MRTTQWTGKGTALILACALTVLGATGFRHNASDGALSCGNCHNHFLFGAYSHEFGSGTAFDCEPNTCHTTEAVGTCAEYHYACVEDLASIVSRGAVNLDEVARLVKEGSSDEVRGLLERYDGVLSYNPSRNAIQVIGCKGRVAAHFTVRDSMAAVLLASD